MNVPFVDLAAQFAEIQEPVEADVLDLMRHCQFVGGPYLERFERALASYLGVRHVVGVSNGTDAITLALESLNIGKGDIVLVPNNSFIASAYGVTRAGANPLMVDVDPYTYLMDIEVVESLLRKNKKIKAVLVVDLYGQMPDMEAFQELTQKYKVYLIEDAAQSMGATNRGRAAGFYSDVATTSFYPAKNLGTMGQGGAVITNNTTVASNVRIIANQGSEKKYEHICLGGNFRLDSIMAAQLYHALKKLNCWNERRRHIAKLYNEAFTSQQRPCQELNSRHIYHLYEFKCKDRDERNRLEAVFKENKIAYGFHYPHLITDTQMYALSGTLSKDLRWIVTPVADDLKTRLISLPIFPTMTEEQAYKVITAVQSVCG